MYEVCFHLKHSKYKPTGSDTATPRFPKQLTNWTKNVIKQTSYHGIISKRLQIVQWKFIEEVNGDGVWREISYLTSQRYEKQHRFKIRLSSVDVHIVICLIKNFCIITLTLFHFISILSFLSSQPDLPVFSVHSHSLQSIFYISV